ncbi:recombinase family protein [Streptomyces axinellae]|uniref:Resolvase/invertase-type recombinase catalytic domain-containing protein n=1 Tax=Streptomyces axinellae TaxID=552788 RepID=A0ABP6CCN0_9ACTN
MWCDHRAGPVLSPPSRGKRCGLPCTSVSPPTKITSPYSLAAQEAKLTAYIQSQPGWEAIGEPFRDEASGATTERPGLQRALAAAEAGRFDVLLVYRVDRLSRSLRGLVEILDRLDTGDTAFRSATEPFDTSTRVGRTPVQMLGVFAQFERETIIDVDSSAAAGTASVAPPPSHPYPSDFGPTGNEALHGPVASSVSSRRILRGAFRAHLIWRVCGSR